MSLFLWFLYMTLINLTLQVRLCREKKSGIIYAMKKLKKSEMVSRGQVKMLLKHAELFSGAALFSKIKLLLLVTRKCMKKDKIPEHNHKEHHRKTHGNLMWESPSSSSTSMKLLLLIVHAVSLFEFHRLVYLVCGWASHIITILIDCRTEWICWSQFYMAFIICDFLYTQVM